MGVVMRLSLNLVRAREAPRVWVCEAPSAPASALSLLAGAPLRSPFGLCPTVVLG